MRNELYDFIAILRDFFMNRKDANSVEACNDILAALDKNSKVPQLFKLNKKEAEDLLKFIVDAGYISHEFHQSIHDLGNRLAEFVKENKR